MTRLANRKARAHHPLAIVLSPTRELAMQINDVINPLATSVHLSSRLIAGGMPYGAQIQALKKEFWSDVRIPGAVQEFNPELDKAGRVADFIELGELMCIDALNRNESCGGHFREESQTEEGEAKRDDANYAYVAAWEYNGEHNWNLHKEELTFEVAKPSQRSYK